MRVTNRPEAYYTESTTEIVLCSLNFNVRIQKSEQYTATPAYDQFRDIFGRL